MHWNQYHFVVVYKIAKSIVYVADPAHGLLKYSKEDFIKNWIGNGADSKTEEGIALLMEPTPRLKEIEVDDKEARKAFLFSINTYFDIKNSCFSCFWDF